MSDPRNAAHDKKVQQEKKHEASPAPDQADAAPEAVAAPSETGADGSGNLEASTAVLSKLKDLAFHSRANLETLAGLSTTIDDELKQQQFSASIGALYSAQDAFQTQVATLVESYGEMCQKLQPSE
ncbi:MAG TPA: hypothetical protein VF593_09120 [Chthoniobacteraceae bacterium]|jgi:hypothetical protein